MEHLTEDQEVELGFRTEALLQSETFKYVTTQLGEMYANSILLSEPHEAKLRESNYLLHRALNDIVSQLDALVTRKNNIMLKREIEEIEQQNG